MALERARESFANALVATLPGDAELVRSAFASVPREAFVGDPPWFIGDPPSLLRHNLDFRLEETREVRMLYRDVIVSIDPDRNLNSGAPSLWATAFDELGIDSGEQVVQVGTGLGYYSAILAEIVGCAGSVTAFEVDTGLAERARANLGPWPNVEVLAKDGASHPVQHADAIVLFAGATHIVAPWLDGLADGGRLYVPLTVNLDDPIRGLGLGFALSIQRHGQEFRARFTNPIAIFPCFSARTKETNAALHQRFQARDSLGDVRSVRRDEHTPDESCWCHMERSCLSTREVE